MAEETRKQNDPGVLHSNRPGGPWLGNIQRLADMVLCSCPPQHLVRSKSSVQRSQPRFQTEVDTCSNHGNHGLTKAGDDDWLQGSVPYRCATNKDLHVLPTSVVSAGLLPLVVDDAT